MQIWDNPYLNIFLLAITWALTLTTSTLLTTIGPRCAISVGATDGMAAFSIGIFLIGAAISSVPSGAIFRNYGRLVGFSLGCGCQIVGGVFGLVAIELSNLGVLFVACFFVGLGQGMGQFYRFAAMEVAPSHLKSRSVTYVLSGGILAAFLGPATATYSVNILPSTFCGSYLLIAVIGVLNEIVICLVNFKPAFSEKDPSSATATPQFHSDSFNRDSVVGIPYDALGNPSHEKNILLATDCDDTLRSRWEIVAQPMFVIACTVATVAHTLMVMMMSNISVAMVDDGYSFPQANLVLEMHFLAMFAPGFFTGALMNRIGTFSVSLLGAVIFAGSALFLATGDYFYNYMAGMILLGIAWNFSFSAGTLMLTSCCSCKPQEAAEVQGINDFVLFSVAGAGGLGSGFIYAGMGWYFLIYIVSAMMVVNLLLFGVMWRYSTDEELAEMQGEIEGQQQYSAENQFSSKLGYGQGSEDKQLLGSPPMRRSLCYSDSKYRYQSID